VIGPEYIKHFSKLYPHFIQIRSWIQGFSSYNRDSRYYLQSKYQTV